MEWKNIPWHKLERVVFKLQKRIYRASQRGDFRAVRRLQKTLIRSWSAKCLSVRQVIRTVTKKCFKTKIAPSKSQQQKHYQRIASIIDAHKSAPQKALIRRLNPVIKEWEKYYSSQVSKRIFKTLDHLVFLKLMSWAKHRHPKKSRKWISNKYWYALENENWVFAIKQKDNQLMRLFTHA